MLPMYAPQQQSVKSGNNLMRRDLFWIAAAVASERCSRRGPGRSHSNHFAESDPTDPMIYIANVFSYETRPEHSSRVRLKCPSARPSGQIEASARFHDTSRHSVTDRQFGAR